MQQNKLLQNTFACFSTKEMIELASMIRLPNHEVEGEIFVGKHTFSYGHQLENRSFQAVLALIQLMGSHLGRVKEDAQERHRACMLAGVDCLIQDYLRKDLLPDPLALYSVLNPNTIPTTDEYLKIDMVVDGVLLEQGYRVTEVPRVRKVREEQPQLLSRASHKVYDVYQSMKCTSKSYCK